MLELSVMRPLRRPFPFPLSRVSPVPSKTIAPPERIVIATRESRLALWQAEHVRGLLQRLYPACSVELIIGRAHV